MSGRGAVVVSAPAKINLSLGVGPVRPDGFHALVEGDARRIDGLWRDHLSAQITFASPEWSLERAAEAMVRGGFRHLVVVDGGEMVGVLSMRDIVRCWVEDGATSSLPRDAAGSEA